VVQRSTTCASSAGLDTRSACAFERVKEISGWIKTAGNFPRTRCPSVARPVSPPTWLALLRIW